jgi:hypothetical protein
MTSRQRTIVTIALRMLADRVLNNDFDFCLETEFEDDPMPPSAGEVFALERRFARIPSAVRHLR